MQNRINNDQTQEQENLTQLIDKKRNFKSLAETAPGLADGRYIKLQAYTQDSGPAPIVRPQAIRPVAKRPAPGLFKTTNTTANSMELTPPLPAQPKLA